MTSTAYLPLHVPCQCDPLSSKQRFPPIRLNPKVFQAVRQALNGFALTSTVEVGSWKCSRCGTLRGISAKAMLLASTH